ncbi:ABC transporter permease subunit [Telmatocola sphagniphila]|uniref:ABC transporter permease subunit n=1 Tax=Telmatocola sphagniphila TaxID=1123043 RepID=A0A8E6B7E0_9BACT|nr:ABC transporter permease subunit [Telmatocola sphagniphila]QVL32834.1 ABC transporter permease subunit [Telmatocola sphagniphila]
MNLPTILLTIQWMVRDTIRQSIAAKLFWVLLGASILCILFCLSVDARGDENLLPLSRSEQREQISKDEALAQGMKLGTQSGLGHAVGAPALAMLATSLGEQFARKEGVDIAQGEISIGFGVIKVQVGRDRTDAVRFLQIWLAGAIADTAGIFLALIWTAGFIPSFLEPGSVTVLLAKPVPRWAILLGKFIGVMLFVSAQAIFFVLGTWIALGLKTGVFDSLYLMAIPMMIVHFGVFFSFSVLMAVWSRNTTVCLLSTLIFWIASWGMNFGWVVVCTQNISAFSPLSRLLLDIGYWTMPKPLDLNMVLYDLLKADGFTMKVPEFKQLQDLKLFRPVASILASLAFGLVMLLSACWEFEKQEY